MGCLGLSSEFFLLLLFLFLFIVLLLLFLLLLPRPILILLLHQPLLRSPCLFSSTLNPRVRKHKLTPSPPSSNVSNALTDKATSKPPRPDSTAGAGSSVTPGVDGWVTSWGLTVRSFLISSSRHHIISLDRSDRSKADTQNPDNQKKIDAVKAQCKSAPGSWAWGSNWDWDSMLSTTVTKEVIVENTL
jgi:hypothetical protein